MTAMCDDGFIPDQATFHNGQAGQPCAPTQLFTVGVPVAIACTVAGLLVAVREVRANTNTARVLALHIVGMNLSLLGAMVSFIVQQAWLEGVSVFIPPLVMFSVSFYSNLWLALVGPVYALRSESMESVKFGLKLFQIGTALAALASGLLFAIVCRNDAVFNYSMAVGWLIVSAYLLVVIPTLIHMANTLIGVINSVTASPVSQTVGSNASLIGLRNRLVLIRRAALAGVPMVAICFVPFPVCFLVLGHTPYSWLFLIAILVALWTVCCAGLVFLYKPKAPLNHQQTPMVTSTTL